MTEFEKWEIAISVLSAVATFLAVYVALWQSKLQFKKKIYIAYNNNYGKIQENCYHTEYVEFLIFNASNIKVTINNIYLGKNVNMLCQVLKMMYCFKSQRFWISEKHFLL